MADIKLKDRNDNEIAYTGVSKIKVPATDGGEDVVFQLPPVLQEKAVTITENGTTSIVPDEGKDGLSKVDVAVDVAGGGGTSVQSDWTQNDETAADYVKNRPGGYDVYSSELAATGSFAPESSDFGYAAVDFPVKFIVDGQKVTVKIENETFERTVQKVPDDQKINKNSLAEYWIRRTEGEEIGDNEWTFIFQLQSEGTWAKGTIVSGTYHGKTFEVYAEVATPVKFPAKYVDTRFIVTCTIAQDSDSNWTVSNPNHTFDEIGVAYRSGVDVVLQAVLGEGFISVLDLQATDGSTAFQWGGVVVEVGLVYILVQKESNTDSWDMYISTPVEQDQLAEIRQLPASTAADKDKFLRVDASGNPVWETVPDTTIKLKSSTAGSTKYFNITVNDSGQITATEAT